ncbi:hypothetical protein Tco_0873915 [Tanacetum coccineum]|uniref:Aminotransferase-like plant mobile domain-containing protein n=1 Tax=Tanacetum coccineum TaxID=301880 RepID=A0ABQ5BPB5_9ASTR
MANQEQNPPQQEQPFVAANQVSFNLEDILLNTNNEFALLYPEHNNKDYFKCVSDFISKCCLRKPFTRSPNMYKEYLAEFWYSTTALENSKVSFSIPTGGISGEVGVNTFRNAINAHSLPHSIKYVTPPSIDVVRKWFPTIGYGEEISQWCFKLPSPLPMLRGFPKAQILELNLDTRSILLQNNPPCPVKSQQKVGPLKHPPLPKLAKPASSFYTSSFIIHSEYASGNDTSGVSTVEADLGNSTPSTDPHVLADKTKYVSDGLETVLATPKIGTSNAVKTSEEIKFGAIKLEDLAKLVPNVKVDFKDLDSPKDDPIIVVDDSEEDEEEDKNEEIHFTTNDETEDILASTSSSPRLKAQPSFPNVGQLNELLVKSLTAKFSKILSAHDFSSSLPTELKDLPSKFNELTEEVKGLKQQVHELELELPGELKDIPSKLEDFTKTDTSLTLQVAELKTLQWELLAEFLSLPI